MVDSAVIRAVLGGSGHPALSQAALDSLVAQGMPALDGGLFDEQACLAWYIGRLRREAFLGALQTRMRAVVDDVSAEMVGKSAAEFESLWRQRVEDAFDGLLEAEGG